MSLTRFFLHVRRPSPSPLFPTRRSSDLSPLGTEAAVGLPNNVGRRPEPRATMARAGTTTRPTHVQARTAHVVRKPDRKSTRLNSSHITISYAVFCLKKKKQ